VKPAITTAKMAGIIRDKYAVKRSADSTKIKMTGTNARIETL
jgi:hypothetical protein